MPFTSGPFNWADYHNGNALVLLPWSLAHRDQGVLYDRDGIRLEVLDYLSNSEIVPIRPYRPAYSARALRFDKSEDAPIFARPTCGLRLTIRATEFWMPCSSPDPLEKNAWPFPRNCSRRRSSARDAEWN